jgi:hypothetical protein
MAGEFKKKKQESSLKSLLSEKQKNSTYNPENLNFSFEDFCCKQKYSSSFKDWQKEGLLSTALDTISGYCKSPIIYDNTGKFTLYNDFPPTMYTLFEFPEHVTRDASWVRIHINGPAVIIGHIIRNTFYIVFFDKTHKFWLGKKDREKYFGKKALKPENKLK